MKKFALLLLSAFFGLGLSAQSWEVDASHSNAGFSVTHMVVSTTLGKFNDFSVTIEGDANDWTKAKITGTAKVESIDTGNEKRDGHLKSADFFDAENHPTIDFKSTKIKDLGDGKLEVTGDLTIRGTTKKVTFDTQAAGPVNDPWGNTKIGLVASTKINRQDFGLSWSATNEAGEAVVANTVTLLLNLELNKAK